MNGIEVSAEQFNERLFWDQLLELIAEGRVVPIIGRTLLTVKYKDKDVQLYPLLAQWLAEYLGVSSETLVEGDELNTVACNYLGKGRCIEDIYPALKAIMPAEAELSIPESLIKLVSIPFKVFVTTTFDSLLERAINQVRFGGQAKTKVLKYSPNAVEDLPAPLEKKDPPVVFHLLGKLSATPNYAVTQEDLLEFFSSLQSENRQPQILFDLLSRSNLLILGCDFGDWLARFFIRTAKRKRLLEARGSIDYVADKRISGDNNLVIFLRYFCSHFKVYHRGGAAEFIEDLHAKWLNRHPEDKDRPPPGGIVEFVKPGAIFLSYASEDLAAAERIRDDLENAGLEVFFDKDDIKLGEDWYLKLHCCIQAASMVIAIISQNTLTREKRYFRHEWKAAQEEARGGPETDIFIIPAVIDGTSLNHPDLARFNEKHAAFLPGGQTDAGFIENVKQLYRKHQKLLTGTL